MAGMKFKIEADLEKLNQLKSKMEEVRKSMADMTKESDPKKFKESEKALKDMEKQYEQLFQQVQKAAGQMRDTGQATSDSIKGVSKTLKEAIQEQKQLIREIKKDIDDLNSKSKDKKLSPGQRDAVSLDLAAAKRALAEEKGALVGMQRQQIEANAAEAESVGGLMSVFGKFAAKILTVGVALQTTKLILESTEKSGQDLEIVTEQMSAATQYFFKTIASGDWSNFLDGLQKAIIGAREYIVEMENIKNLTNEQKIRSSVLDVKIGQAYADSYSTDPKVQKSALEKIIAYNKEKYTGEARIARETYEARVKDVAARNKWNTTDLENTISYYSKMKTVIENGERYNALMQSRKAYEGGMIGETRIKPDTKMLGKIDTQMNAIPNGAYSGGIAKSFSKVTFPERDEMATLLATSNMAEAQIDLNNKRIQMRLRALRMQEESAADDASKKRIEYQIEAGRRRVDTAFDIEQQVLSAERDGFEKSTKQAELNYRKTISDIDRRRDDMLRKQNEMSGGIDAKSGKKTKSYSSVLNPADQSQIDQLKLQAQDLLDKGMLDQLLVEFETFQQKRLQIAKEFDAKIKALAGTDQANEAQFKKQEALDEIDKQIAARSAVYSRWAKNLAGQSLKDLDSLLKDYEVMSVKLNKDGNLTDNDKAVLREQIRALQAKIQELTSDKNTAKESKKDWSETLRTMNEVNQASKNIISSFGDMDAGTKAVLESVVNLSSGVISAMTGFENLARAVSLAEKASAVLAIIGAILQAYNAIKDSIKSIVHAKDAQREAAREEYLALVEYNEELRNRYEWTQKIGEATLDYLKREGEELVKQSAENEKLQSDLWKKLQGSDYKDGRKINFWGENVINWESLSGKTYEEIGELAAKGKLSKEGLAFYEALKKAKDEGADLIKMEDEYHEKVRETYTGTTRDAIVSSIIEGFKAGKRGAADFAETFGDLMRGALVGALALAVDAQVGEWFVKFGDFSKSDGSLSQEEIDKLKKDWNVIINGLSVQAENMEKVTGVSLAGGAANGSSTGSKSSFSSMSQDSASALEGRFTAVQIASEVTRDNTTKLTGQMDTLLGQNTTLSQAAIDTLNEMKFTRIIQIKANEHLENISKYTSELPEMNKRLDKVVKNTEGLRKK